MNTFATATMQLWSRLARDTAVEAVGPRGVDGGPRRRPAQVLPTAEGREELLCPGSR
jgi:hypothetical protein